MKQPPPAPHRPRAASFFGVAALVAASACTLTWEGRPPAALQGESRYWPMPKLDAEWLRMIFQRGHDGSIELSSHWSSPLWLVARLLGLQKYLRRVCTRWTPEGGEGGLQEV